MKTLLIILLEVTGKIEDSTYDIIQHASFKGAFVQIESGNDMSFLITKSEKDWYLSKSKLSNDLAKVIESWLMFICNKSWNQYSCWNGIRKDLYSVASFCKNNNVKPEKESLELIPRSFLGDLKQFSVIILVKLLIADRSAQMHIKLVMTDNRGDSINQMQVQNKSWTRRLDYALFDWIIMMLIEFETGGILPLGLIRHVQIHIVTLLCKIAFEDQKEAVLFWLHYTDFAIPYLSLLTMAMCRSCKSSNTKCHTVTHPRDWSSSNSMTGATWK